MKQSVEEFEAKMNAAKDDLLEYVEGEKLYSKLDVAQVG